MSFHLKNTRVIYLKMVNQVSKEQKRRNIEVLVDDLLVKIKLLDRHIHDLK